MIRLCTARTPARVFFLLVLLCHKYHGYKRNFTTEFNSMAKLSQLEKYMEYVCEALGHADRHG